MRLHKLIRAGYSYSLALDGIPAAVQENGEKLFSKPVPLGYYNETSNFTVLYNHLHLEVQVTDALSNGYNIVGFSVEPMSIDHRQLDKFNK